MSKVARARIGNSRPKTRRTISGFCPISFVLLLCASLGLAACANTPDMAPVASNDAGVPNLPANLKTEHAPPQASTFSTDKGEGHQALDGTLTWGTANYLQVGRFKKWVAKLQGGKAASTGVPR